MSTLSTRPQTRRAQRAVLGWAVLMLAGVGVVVVALVPSLQSGAEDPTLPAWHRPVALALGFALAAWQLLLAVAAVRGRGAIAAEGVRGTYVAASVVMLLASAIGAVLFSWAAAAVALSALVCLVASLAIPRSGPSDTVLGHGPVSERSSGPGVSPRSFWVIVLASLVVATVGLTVAVVRAM